MTPAILTAKLAELNPGMRSRLDQILPVFKPDTVLKWHHDLDRIRARYEELARRARIDLTQGQSDIGVPDVQRD